MVPSTLKSWRGWSPSEPVVDRFMINPRSKRLRGRAREGWGRSPLQDFAKRKLRLTFFAQPERFQAYTNILFYFFLSGRAPMMSRRPRPHQYYPDRIAISIPATSCSYATGKVNHLVHRFIAWRDLTSRDLRARHYVHRRATLPSDKLPPNLMSGSRDEFLLAAVLGGK